MPDRFKISDVVLECSSCGSSQFQLPLDAAESGKITCYLCGEFVGTVAEVDANLREQGKSLLSNIAEALEQTLKGF